MQPQGKCKTKTIQADLGIFTHIPVYSDIFRNWSGIFWTLCSPCIFTTLIYLESWHIYKQWNIQNTGIFRTGGILRTLSNIYIGKLWETANGYNYFASCCYIRNIRFSSALVHERKYDFFNVGLIFIPEVFI